MAKIISRKDAFDAFFKVLSEKEGFVDEIKNYRVITSYYMYLNKDLVKEMKYRIKRYHMKHNQQFVIVNNLENMVKFIKNGIPSYSILISENSGIVKTSLGKFDEKKLLDVLLIKVSDVYRYDDFLNVINLKENNVHYIGLYVFDSLVSQLDLHNTDILTASQKVFDEIVRLAIQIKNKYGQRVCNHQNCWDKTADEIVWEINEKFVANNHTETIDRYNLCVRYYDVLTYMFEVLEYKIKGEIEDPESIPEPYYKNLSQYCNGFIYTSDEVDKFKIVRSKVSIGGNSRIKNLRDYILTLNNAIDKEKLLEQVDKLAALASEIIAEDSEATDNKKLLTPTINFVDKSYVEQHINEQKILNYQSELNNLLNLVSQINE